MGPALLDEIMEELDVAVAFVDRDDEMTELVDEGATDELEELVELLGTGNTGIKLGSTLVHSTMSLIVFTPSRLRRV